jgi:hypothetical protein
MLTVMFLELSSDKNGKIEVSKCYFIINPQGQWYYLTNLWLITALHILQSQPNNLTAISNNHTTSNGSRRQDFDQIANNDHLLTEIH